ncbi:hypothetical protein ILUMI_23195 [Ignelater luminosus]|uniref:Histone acetyltransferase n=1 Tax=Ignelater luminosus TaxID=2038154 RepID=A0A8K0CF27_IGNLU|nr:hypothetical protein ILUMI_23195 [Ignelater luminosus]
MCDIKYRDRILEAIDQLRRRKARPDIQRICNFLMRRHSINSNDAKADLQKCVDREIVLKVEYKGSISYRNAAKKFSHLKRAEGSENLPAAITYSKPNRKFVALLTNAFAELIVHEPDYLEVGVPGLELIRNILSKDNVRYTKKYVSILLEKEVEIGGLIKMENGNYLLGPTKSELPLETGKNDRDFSREKDEKDGQKFFMKKERKKTVKLGMKRAKMEIGGGDERDYKPGENGMLRVGRRRKRAKKVFDPSDNNLPKKRGRPVGSLNKSTIEKQLAKLNDGESRPESRSSFTSREQGGVCSVCHNNRKVPNDRLVACRECSNKAHVSCLNGEDMMLKMYPDNTWQCPHCKTCCICFETSDAGYLTICSVCADAYHADCHKPRIVEKIKSGAKWLCINCQMPEQLQVAEIHPNVSSSDVFTHRLIDDDKNYGSPALSIEEDSNHNSLPLSPTPPTLSPQGMSGVRSAAASPEIKCSLSDSQSVKEMDIDDIIDPLIPDATHWTCDDVYNYFLQYFPDEAKVFKEQEIDGRSLLLMKRMDVIGSLKLKLGPALKIYRHVVKLQFRRDDPKLYWL